MTPDLYLRISEGAGPASQLMSANERLHWAQRVSKTRYWHDLALVEAKKEVRRKPDTYPYRERVHITVSIAWPDQRRRDAANYAPTAKAIVDGLVKGGIITDDANRYVIGPDLRALTGPWSVTLAIETAA